MEACKPGRAEPKPISCVVHVRVTNLAFGSLRRTRRKPRPAPLPGPLSEMIPTRLTPPLASTANYRWRVAHIWAGPIMGWYERRIFSNIAVEMLSSRGNQTIACRLPLRLAVPKRPRCVPGGRVSQAIAAALRYGSVIPLPGPYSSSRKWNRLRSCA